MIASDDTDILVDRIIATGGYRVLRRLDLETLVDPSPADRTTTVGVAVDCETTGLDPTSDTIIELSLRRFRYDAAGIITKLDRPYAWLQDPGRPLDPAITVLTGLSDADLAGQEIDEHHASALLASADIRICHNASFDRPFVSRRLPSCSGLSYACTLYEIDWRARGFDGNGRALGWLLAQAGYFNDAAHRASADVDAVIALLAHRSLGRETALAELIETASRPTWSFTATGAHFDVKDALRRRGYRWNPKEKVWGRAVSYNEAELEHAWLAEHVYASQHMPRMEGPVVREVTWLTRHG